MIDDATPEQILTCDVCRGPIDDLGLAMLFWDTEGDNCESSLPVTALVLAHKRCDSPRGDVDRLGLSAELGWLVTPTAALSRLAQLVSLYQWDAAQLRRLALVAWAVPLVHANKGATDD